MLWPLVLLDVSERHNVLKFDKNGKIFLDKVSGVQGDVGIKHFHTRVVQCMYLTPDYRMDMEISLSGTQEPGLEFILGTPQFMLTQWL